MGPCIVTADEFDTYPPALPIRSRVNGELRQDSNTKLQILISTMSSTSFRRA